MHNKVDKVTSLNIHVYKDTLYKKEPPPFGE